MLRAALLSTASLLTAVPALAADMPAYTPEAAVAAAHDWTGFYAGVNVGYGSGDIGTTDSTVTTTGPLVGIPAESLPDGTTFPGDDSSADIEGVIGGGQIGYNHQVGSLVFGIEGTIQGAELETSSAFLGSEAGPFYETEAALDFYGTVVGRVGFAFDRVLVYANGGLAIGQGSASLSITGGTEEDPTGPTFSDDQEETFFGYAVGAGVEFAMFDNWSVKAEYQYLDFGDETFDFEFPATGDGSSATSTGEIDLHTVKVGLNYHF
ncbi:outer membrane protein [Terrihabitans rhizophilus]|uniref:Outer membrane protein n=1 Tax=Terrihabitans rhizophilus TaxID=3092662 RepID=A0ABU4RKG8_9HYPH|nr:outer membrane protein [Terrihabitans sp. PJ23]MDX6805302.1 outer membrane protein [Terrihabitans sp. PJ23]